MSTAPGSQGQGKNICGRKSLLLIIHTVSSSKKKIPPHSTGISPVGRARPSCALVILPERRAYREALERGIVGIRVVQGEEVLVDLDALSVKSHLLEVGHYVRTCQLEILILGRCRWSFGFSLSSSR